MNYGHCRHYLLPLVIYGGTVGYKTEEEESTFFILQCKIGVFPIIL